MKFLFESLVFLDSWGILLDMTDKSYLQIKIKGVFYEKVSNRRHEQECE